MALTDALIKGLKPIADSRYSKADGGGLLLDVTPGGVKSWVFRYQFGGKREKMVIGRYPDVTLKAARDERSKLVAQVARGESPAAEKKLARAGLTTNPTVREFGERVATITAGLIVTSWVSIARIASLRTVGEQ